MVVLDTHVWLWWVAAPERLSDAATDAITRVDEVGIVTISCWELVMLAEKGLVNLDRDPAQWVRQGLAREGIRVLSVSPQAAVAAAQIPADELAGDPADRIIYSCARAAGARLVTKDSRLRSFDPRGTVW